MASPSDITSPYSRSETESSNEWTYSFHNESSSSNSSDTSLETYRWYGSKYFDYKMAQQIMASRGQQQADFEATLTRRQEEFPYSSAYNMIRPRVNTGVGPGLSRRCDSLRVAYMTAIGKIRMTGTASDKEQLSISLKGISNSSQTSQPNSRSPSIETERAVPIFQEDDNNNSEDDDQLPRYSMALNEHGQKNGVLAIYSTPVMVRLEPPLWEITVTYGNNSWTASDMRKKKAAHKAAKLACLAMGIEHNGTRSRL